jgi:hypothetical protein
MVVGILHTPVYWRVMTSTMALDGLDGHGLWILLGWSGILGLAVLRLAVLRLTVTRLSILWLSVVWLTVLRLLRIARLGLAWDWLVISLVGAVAGFDHMFY